MLCGLQVECCVGVLFLNKNLFLLFAMTDYLNSLAPGVLQPFFLYRDVDCRLKCFRARLQGSIECMNEQTFWFKQDWKLHQRKMSLNEFGCKPYYQHHPFLLPTNLAANSGCCTLLRIIYFLNFTSLLLSVHLSIQENWQLFCIFLKQSLKLQY